MTGVGRTSTQKVIQKVRTGVTSLFGPTTLHVWRHCEIRPPKSQNVGDFCTLGCALSKSLKTGPEALIFRLFSSCFKIFVRRLRNNRRFSTGCPRRGLFWAWFLAILTFLRVFATKMPASGCHRARLPGLEIAQFSLFS